MELGRVIPIVPIVNSPANNWPVVSKSHHRNLKLLQLTEGILCNIQRAAVLVKMAKCLNVPEC